MTADQRRSAMEKALAELLRRGSGYVIFSDAENGDNYAEIDSSMRAEVTHRRWPASKLPALEPDKLSRLDRLGYRETERNLQQSFNGWALPRMAKNLEQVFIEVYECAPAFDLKVTPGKPE